MLLFSSIIFILILYNVSIINWWVGVILLASLILYIFYIIKNDLRKDTENVIEDTFTLPKSILIFLLGLIGVSLGANLLIEGSIDLAKYYGIRETVIGLGVLAFGTSLPEVATSIIAAIKKENNIAIGNKALSEKRVTKFIPYFLFGKIVFFTGFLFYMMQG